MRKDEPYFVFTFKNEALMSYHPPQQQASRKKGGGGLFFLILLGVGAFLIFSKLGNGPAGGDGPGQQKQRNPQSAVEPIDDEYASQREAVFGPDEPESKVGQRMPSTGGTGAAAGWDIEDVATKKNHASPVAVPAAPARTQKGDWAIEEVERKAPENKFKFSNQSNPPVAKPGGDWAIEEVQPKTNAKTQKGDWSIEETN